MDGKAVVAAETANCFWDSVFGAFRFGPGLWDEGGSHDCSWVKTFNSRCKEMPRLVAAR